MAATHANVLADGQIELLREVISEAVKKASAEAATASARANDLAALASWAHAVTSESN